MTEIRIRAPPSRLHLKCDPERVLLKQWPHQARWSSALDLFPTLYTGMSTVANQRRMKKLTKAAKVERCGVFKGNKDVLAWRALQHGLPSAVPPERGMFEHCFFAFFCFADVPHYVSLLSLSLIIFTFWWPHAWRFLTLFASFDAQQ